MSTFFSERVSDCYFGFRTLRFNFCFFFSGRINCYFVLRNYTEGIASHACPTTGSGPGSRLFCVSFLPYRARHPIQIGLSAVPNDSRRWAVTNNSSTFPPCTCSCGGGALFPSVCIPSKRLSAATGFYSQRESTVKYPKNT